MLSWHCKATHGFCVVANDKSRHKTVNKIHVERCYIVHTHIIDSLSSSFSLCQGVCGAAPNFSTASSDSLFHPSCLFSSSSSLPPLLPSSHLSLHRPPIPALVSLVSFCPPHITQPLSSVVCLITTILPSSALVSLAIFVPSCFRILAAFVVVVRSLPRFPFCTGMPVSHKCS